MCFLIPVSKCFSYSTVKYPPRQSNIGVSGKILGNSSDKANKKFCLVFFSLMKTHQTLYYTYMYVFFYYILVFFVVVVIFSLYINLPFFIFFYIWPIYLLFFCVFLYINSVHSVFNIARTILETNVFIVQRLLKDWRSKIAFWLKST